MVLSRHLPFILILSMGLNSFAQNKVAEDKIELFKAQQVTLLPSVFKRAQTTDLNYMLALKPDRLLAPYLREAGLPTKAQPYPNWESKGLDGHIGGHYLTALSLMYAATGDKRINDRLHYMLAELKKCQDKNGNGYVGGVPGGKLLWAQLSSGNIQASGFDLNKKWVPFYNIHKVFAGLRDAYLYTGNPLAKQMFIAYADWFLALTAKLNNQQIQQLLITEHGGVNEVLADAYALTQNKKYLELAYKFSDQRIFSPLSHGQDSLTGLHANTQIPKVIGFKRIGMLNSDSLYSHAASVFWNTVVNNRSVAIGGHSVREHFNPTNDFSAMLTSAEGPETCNSYNMLKLTKLLYETEGLGSYIDYYERTLYNHILSSQHPEKGGFVYYTPMRSGHYRVYSQPENNFWCCVGSGLENHAKYNELIYAHKNNNLFLNLFIPSVLNWKEKEVVITQTTAFPESELTKLVIAAKKASKFTLQVRYPKWIRPGEIQIMVNGKPFAVRKVVNGYIAVERTWKNGDRVAIKLPMHISLAQMPDKSNYFAVLNGPIVLAAKTSDKDLVGLFADTEMASDKGNGPSYPLNEMPMFLTETPSFENKIVPVAQQKMVFKAPQLIYQQQYKDLRLIPFYKLHDSRYVIYWQTVNAAGLEALQKKMAKQEMEAAALASQTLDVVYPGEQQPEKDHGFAGEQTSDGTHKERRWRSAKGWFSYQLATNNETAIKLRLTYYGQDRNRRFKILVNETVVASVSLDGDKGDTFNEVDYPIPPALLNKAGGKITVKLKAEPNSETAGLYGLRLMKDN